MNHIDKLAQTLWDYNKLESSLTKADVILILGSNDIRVAERGAELFLQGYAPLVVCSGKVGVLTKRMWNKSEAEVFAEEIIKLGVPKEKILIESEATNTGENITYTKTLLKNKGVIVNRVILVQKPYMLRRAYATFKNFWPESDVITTGPQLTFEKYPNDIISKELLINIMVGDTQRIKLYADMGFQIPQEMPEVVWAAYQKLVELGYSKHLVI
ncbi:MAG: YdcF family protein [Patescibacteria group bacterium]